MDHLILPALDSLDSSSILLPTVFQRSAGLRYGRGIQTGVRLVSDLAMHTSKRLESLCRAVGQATPLRRANSICCLRSAFIERCYNKHQVPMRYVPMIRVCRTGCLQPLWNQAGWKRTASSDVLSWTTWQPPASFLFQSRYVSLLPPRFRQDLASGLPRTCQRHSRSAPHLWIYC